MPYQFPPWIQPPESLARNFGAGVAAGQNQQEMQLRAQSDAAKLQLAQQAQLQEEAYRARQQGISEQELAMNQQLSAAKVREIQQAFDARQQYQQAIQSGMDPIKAGFQFLAPAGESMTGLAQYARNQRLDELAKQPPRFFDDPTGKYHLYQDPSGKVDQLHDYTGARQSDYWERLPVQQAYRKQAAVESAIMKMESDDSFKLILTTAKDNPNKLNKLQIERLKMYKALVDKSNELSEDIDTAIAKHTQGGGQGTNSFKVISVREKGAPGTNAPPASASTNAPQAMMAPSGYAPPYGQIAAPSGGIIPPGLNQRLGEERMMQRDERDALVAKALRELADAPAVRNWDPNMASGQTNPEDYAPYDPQSGLPTYVQ